MFGFKLLYNFTDTNIVLLKILVFFMIDHRTCFRFLLRHLFLGLRYVVRGLTINLNTSLKFWQADI